MPNVRYAIYYAPRPEEPLAAFGRSWLQRDAEEKGPGRSPPPSDLSDVGKFDVVSAPRHYGLHATLKPPFVPRAGVTAAVVVDAVGDLAARRSVVSIGRVELKSIGRFLALVPSAPAVGLEELAADCVAALDHMREPPTDAEVARRRGADLTARQDELLRLWGYPYVMEQFRFHITLTGPLDAVARGRVYSALAPLIAPLTRDEMLVRDLVVFVEEYGAPMHVLARIPLRP